MPIIRDLSDISEREFYSAKSYNDWAAYDGLVDYGAKAHYRVKHSKNEFAKSRNHINGIENFWGYAKHRLKQIQRNQKREFFASFKRNFNLGIILKLGSKICIKSC